MQNSRHVNLDTRRGGRKPSAENVPRVHAGGVKRLVALVLGVTVIAACESSRSLTDTPTTETSVEPTFTGTDTTPPSTSDGSLTSGPTTSIVDLCVPEGDIAPQSSDDPLLMSSMIGVDIRAGAHACFERVVIELGGAGDFPGWTVEYVDDPVPLGESGTGVDIAGVATLQVTMRMWMPTMEGGGYVGPIQFAPENVSHILELRETGNHEGSCTWSIGLDAQYPFTVTILPDPDRLIIDFQIP